MVGPLKPNSAPTKSELASSKLAKSELASSELARSGPSGTTRRTAVGLILGAPLLGACAGVQQSLSQFSSPSNSQAAAPAGTPQEPLAVGNGQVKVGLILPLSASGNAAVAAQSM